ncbi:MAG: pyridoxamine 5'-phosphate oxidase family protein [Candidatus Limnocylindria bacterium]
MTPGDPMETMRPLAEAPSAAVLVVRQEDGSPLVTPVWFRVSGDAFEVVIAAGDRKLAHLRRDPRCVFLVFETTPPFRGAEVHADAELSGENVEETRLAITTRYLGTEGARRFVAARGPGFVVRLPISAARTWDLGGILPDHEP